MSTRRITGNVRGVHVVIMGCGRVGSTLARSLEDRNHTVSVIDSDPDAFRRLGPMFNGTKVTGYGFDRAVLTEAGIERADAFAAVSSGDNSNIIAARVARDPSQAVAAYPEVSSRSGGSAASRSSTRRFHSSQEG